MGIQRSRYSAPYLPEVFFPVFWEQRRKRRFLGKRARLVVPRLKWLYLPLPTIHQDALKTGTRHIAHTLLIVETEVNGQIQRIRLLVNVRCIPCYRQPQ